MLLRRAATPLLALALLAAPALAGCGGGSDESPSQLLSRAKTTLDDANSVHFVLDSDNAPATGTALLGGEGDFLRPSSFKGSLKVLTGGNTVDLHVVSVGGTVYVQLPFIGSYSVVDPAQSGLGDPGALLDPDTGISQLLAKAQDARLGDEKRVGGEVVQEVSAQLPGDLVQQLLTSKDPSKPVAARFSVATDSGQLRRAELTGPFFSAEDDATYTIDLSDFGADVHITAPPTG
jgi:LppX_LprAFG lipoprotein